MTCIFSQITAILVCQPLLRIGAHGFGQENFSGRQRGGEMKTMLGLGAASLRSNSTVWPANGGEVWLGGERGSNLKSTKIQIFLPQLYTPSCFPRLCIICAHTHAFPVEDFSPQHALLVAIQTLITCFQWWRSHSLVRLPTTAHYTNTPGRFVYLQAIGLVSRAQPSSSLWGPWAWTRRALSTLRCNRPVVLQFHHPPASDSC